MSNSKGEKEMKRNDERDRVCVRYRKYTGPSLLLRGVGGRKCSRAEVAHPLDTGRKSLAAGHGVA